MTTQELNDARKKEIIERLCAMASALSAVKDHERMPHDCFCGRADIEFTQFQFDDGIIEFIDAAIKEKIRREFGAYSAMCYRFNSRQDQNK